MMILFTVLVSSLIVITIADCDACVEGYCHKKMTLLENVEITDQLAIDWTDNILYVQLNWFLNTAFYIKNYTITKMHVVQSLKTSGMAVDQYTQELYTADFNNNVYVITQGSNSAKIASSGVLDGTAAFLFFHNKLYVAKRGIKNMFHFDKTELIAARDLVNFTVTDFVKTDKGAIFIADGHVYEYKWPFKKPPKILATKNMVLSTDKFENVYMGAARQRAIYKKCTTTNKVIVYAAYTEGSADKLIFDKNNNIIVYDAKNKMLSIWKRSQYTCTIVLPHPDIQINVHKPHNTRRIYENVDEYYDIDDNIVYDFFWKQFQNE